MKAVVAAFNQEKALVGAFSVLTNLRMELFQALVRSFTKLRKYSPSPPPSLRAMSRGGPRNKPCFTMIKSDPGLCVCCGFHSAITRLMMGRMKKEVQLIHQIQDFLLKMLSAALLKHFICYLGA